MNNKKPLVVAGINLSARFDKNNITFIIRFILSLFVPVLAYFGLSLEDLTSWSALGSVFMDAISNPYVLGLTVFNALNNLPDSTSGGISDSKLAKEYKRPNNIKK